MTSFHLLLWPFVQNIRKKSNKDILTISSFVVDIDQGETSFSHVREHVAISLSFPLIGVVHARTLSD